MDGRRPCPYCAEPILAEALKCPFCRETLPGAAPPAAAVPAPALVNRDDEHLKLLSVFHYVLAGIAALFGSFPLIHVAMGIALVAGAFPTDSSDGPPPEIGWIFIVMGGLFVLGGWTLAVLLFLAARSIAGRRRHFFCLVVAGASCLIMPLGTVLGVFTLLVLLRPTVKPLFDSRSPDGPLR